MIIENKWFIVQGPVRADLSGRPWGVLFIWKPGDFPMKWQPPFEAAGVTIEGRWVRQCPPYAPRPRAREFGFFLPSLWHAFVSLFPKKYEFLDCAMLLDADDQVPDDWQKWPDDCRKASHAAVMRAVAERPGCKIVSDRSSCYRRVDLSSQPLQLYRYITLRLAA